jgi:hypothetical protein
MIDMVIALALMAMDAQTTPPPAATNPAATATPVAPAPAADAQAKQRNNSDLVCKRLNPPTGTRVGRSKRVCRPAVEWEMASEAAKKAASDAQSSRQMAGGGN